MATNPNANVAALNTIDAVPPAAQMTTAEAAIYLRSSQDRLERMRKDGIGPACVKATGSNGAISYRKCDLDDWLASVKAGGKI